MSVSDRRKPKYMSVQQTFRAAAKIDILDSRQLEEYGDGAKNQLYKTVNLMSVLCPWLN